MNITELVDNARYSENLESLLNKFKVKEVLDLWYESDYQGFVEIAALLEDGRVFSYRYEYGSCSGCDEWEDRELTDEQIEQEMERDAVFYNSLEQYNAHVASLEDKNHCLE